MTTTKRNRRDQNKFPYFEVFFIEGLIIHLMLFRHNNFWKNLQHLGRWSLGKDMVSEILSARQWGGVVVKETEWRLFFQVGEIFT